MRNWIIWSFGRGSFQYDVLCGLILIMIFALPSTLFNDRPDFMKLPREGEVQRSVDDDGNIVYTVGIRGVIFGSASRESESAALRRLEASLGLDEPPQVSRVVAIHNTRSTLVAYAFWMEP